MPETQDHTDVCTDVGLVPDIKGVHSGEESHGDTGRHRCARVSGQSPLHKWGGLFRFSLPLLFFQDFLILYFRAFHRVIIQLFFFFLFRDRILLCGPTGLELIMETRLALSS